MPDSLANFIGQIIRSFGRELVFGEELRASDRLKLISSDGCCALCIRELESVDSEVRKRGVANRLWFRRPYECLCSRMCFQECFDGCGLGRVGSAFCDRQQKVPELFGCCDWEAVVR